MFQYDFSFDTLTAAQYGRGVLDSMYLPVRLLRAPQAAAKHGCAYVLRVAGRDGARAAELLRQNGSGYSASFRILPDGTAEEAGL